MSSSNQKLSKKDIAKIRAMLAMQPVEEDVKKSSLESILFSTSKTNPFFGSILQCMNISYSYMLPTAGVSFNNDLKRWDLLINPHFYCKVLSQENRKAVMLHELYHITHKHPLRLPFLQLQAKKRKLMNVAMDMAINQYIKDIPDGCEQCSSLPIQMRDNCENPMCPGTGINVEHYADVDNKGKEVPWLKFQTAEYYYEKLLEMFKDAEEDGEEGEGEGNGEGEGEGNGKGKGKGMPSTMDEHNWDGSAEEKDMLEATEDLIKRAMVKNRFSYDDLPGHVKELLQHIDQRKAELDYRAIIMMAVKQSLPTSARKHSWTRMSRRYGEYAPGTRDAADPELEIFLDTSGSISVEEGNEFLDIVDELLRVGAKRCQLNLFNTNNYYSQKYKCGARLVAEEWQSGGTDLEESLRIVSKKRPDLAIYVTDGYFGSVDIDKMVGPNEKFPRTIFIISKDGDENHPLSKHPSCFTIKIPGGRR